MVVKDKRTKMLKIFYCLLSILIVFLLSWIISAQQEYFDTPGFPVDNFYGDNFQNYQEFSQRLDADVEHLVQQLEYAHSNNHDFVVHEDMFTNLKPMLAKLNHEQKMKFRKEVQHIMAKAKQFLS